MSIALHLESKGLGARQLEPRQRLRRPRMAGKKVEGTVYVSCHANNVPGASGWARPGSVASECLPSVFVY